MKQENSDNSDLNDILWRHIHFQVVFAICLQAVHDILLQC